MFESISKIVKEIDALNKRAVQEYKPIVDTIVSSQSLDTKQIEHALDGMLGFCGYTPMLELYRRLCRHYYYIDPIATVYYVQAYREMWDSDVGEQQSNPPIKPIGRL
jgi:hypothetical protein